VSYIKTNYSITNIKDAQLAINSLVQWINSELTKIEDESRRPLVQGISFEQQYVEPVKYQEGDLYYFATGQPSAPGLFIREASSWRKL